MFTLGIIDKLTPGGLTGGKTIAGTGTIDGFGQVGPIGGIQQKIAGVTGHGPSDSPRVFASYFLAPASECADAKAAAPAGLVVIRVDTLATAVAALKTIKAGGTDFPRCRPRPRLPAVFVIMALYRVKRHDHGTARVPSPAWRPRSRSRSSGSSNCSPSPAG
jgi:hypothetical protein